MYRCFSTSNIEFCDEKVSKLSKNKQKISIFLAIFHNFKIFCTLNDWTYGANPETFNEIININH